MVRNDISELLLSSHAVIVILCCSCNTLRNMLSGTEYETTTVVATSAMKKREKGKRQKDTITSFYQTADCKMLITGLTLQGTMHRSPTTILLIIDKSD